ncbi:MAG: hypothetical protein P8H42_01720 [Saprospiraceae bacterium]|nr:hypothetical protein [Saprospiraceae bacterium]
MKDNLSFDEFICITLLYAANVNEEFTPKEKATIIKSVSITTYEKIYAIFDKMSDFEALETIMAYKGIHYPTSDRKQEVLDKIESIFKVNNAYDIVEKEIFHFLEKLL